MRTDENHLSEGDAPGAVDRRLEAIVGPVLEGMGYALVRVQSSGGRRPTLQVMAERRDGKAMAIADCAEITRMLSATLDVEDPIRGAYTLEVSSPGIDRPLVRAADYERFAGFLARVETRAPVDGRKRFTGIVLGSDGELVRLRVDDNEIELPLAGIARAKLVLTDQLIAATETPLPQSS